ncbi:MAG: 23S rRNA (adenine(2503)-C(2))-methyltransferase RlmN [Planctomycetia bacterium]|nr:23S rRNA (adenine(2503)-C(2))-methyltransferase RlmN [Planctomycetia bacterium]
MSASVLPVVAPRPGLLTVSPDYLRAWLTERSQPAMRAGQLHRWLFTGRATSFKQMTDLPLGLRTELSAHFAPLACTVARRLTSSDGTEKLLLQLADGHLVECVLLKELDRRTVCISTQVGCAMGCVFCASGLEGVTRNLTRAEMLEQLLHCRNLLPANERLTHVVVMGMGEPLANLDALLAALDVACSPQGLGLSARHIHISTVGLPAKIRQLADLGKSYHLAVSLHAPDDVLRTRIVPTNDKIGLEAILEAADYFQAKTGRQVTYEYVLLGGVNDGAVQARMLARLLRGRQAHVNLIPFNDVPGLPFQRLSREALTTFVETLQQARISVKVRKRKGADIDAACGQLRRAALAETVSGSVEGGGAPPLIRPVSPSAGLGVSQGDSSRETTCDSRHRRNE